MQRPFKYLGFLLDTRLLVRMSLLFELGNAEFLGFLFEELSANCIGTSGSFLFQKNLLLQKLFRKGTELQDVVCTASKSCNYGRISH